MKNLPIGLQTFSDLIMGNFVYVDKTDIIHDLVRKKSLYFLARPRRFGKSLLISTLQSIFQGQKELFKGLALSKLDYNWAVRPIIRIDFSEVNRNTPETFLESLRQHLNREAKKYNIEVNLSHQPRDILKHLIEEIYAQHGPVVLLVDEYDKPILDHLKSANIAEEMRLHL